MRAAALTSSPDGCSPVHAGCGREQRVLAEHGGLSRSLRRNGLPEPPLPCARRATPSEVGCFSRARRFETPLGRTNRFRKCPSVRAALDAACQRSRKSHLLCRPRMARAASCRRVVSALRVEREGRVDRGLPPRRRHGQAGLPWRRCEGRGWHRQGGQLCLHPGMPLAAPHRVRRGGRAPFPTLHCMGSVRWRERRAWSCPSMTRARRECRQAGAA